MLVPHFNFFEVGLLIIYTLVCSSFNSTIRKCIRVFRVWNCVCGIYSTPSTARIWYKFPGRGVQELPLQSIRLKDRWISVHFLGQIVLLNRRCRVKCQWTTFHWSWNSWYFMLPVFQLVQKKWLTNQRAENNIYKRIFVSFQAFALYSSYDCDQKGNKLNKASFLFALESKLKIKLFKVLCVSLSDCFFSKFCFIK